MTRRKDLTSEERQVVALFLFRNSADGKLNYGTQKAAMTKWGCCRSSIARLWKAAKKEQAQGQLICVQSKKINEVRRKRVHIDLELISSLELHKRGTIRRLATGINCSKSTMGRWISRGLIRAHSSAIRPDLTGPNKLLRLKFSLEHIEYDRICMALKFKSMHNVVHIDEKWFYITKTNHRFYLTPQETEPHRTCKSKKFITKEFFLSLRVPAERSSKNRQAGTLEEKPIQSITKEVIKECIINKVWMSNDKYYSSNKGLLFDISFDIRIVHQPPNSPDTNINDLGWFRAIQSLQVQSVCSNAEDLVKAVQISFNELSPNTLNYVFLSLQG
ncbi:uncharacterized protein LOC131023535 [Salvia miltiorrhiza]|uniref:uncharacterized protein LOC131023535 n=1 Tax=Salvia miltiorrhiza TaxID=226208 RepID=UPI0025ABE980|nr:uncharacterized protein LOC131023535 [Salvia miltiorrhiza]